jgi:hypothetical protein
MDVSRVLVAVAVSAIVVTTVVSGPAVGLVDLTQPRVDLANLGQGNATVAAVDAPDTVRIERSLQSESYTLAVPDARLRLASVTGRPTVSYKVAIPGLNYTRGTTHFLDESDTGWVALAVEPDTLASDRIEATDYEGRLTITLRYNDTERIVHDESVTVEVVE